MNHYKRCNRGYTDHHGDQYYSWLCPDCDQENWFWFVPKHLTGPDPEPVMQCCKCRCRWIDDNWDERELIEDFIDETFPTIPDLVKHSPARIGEPQAPWENA